MFRLCMPFLSPPWTWDTRKCEESQFAGIKSISCKYGGSTNVGLVNLMLLPSALVIINSSPGRWHPWLCQRPGESHRTVLEHTGCGQPRPTYRQRWRGCWASLRKKNGGSEANEKRQRAPEGKGWLNQSIHFQSFSVVSFSSRGRV